MVNLVIVSHSAKLAQGVAELANQMLKDGCRLAIAAGIDDESNPIGTDSVKVMSAIEDVYDSDGVLVLMDLGSALLSAETALDLLDPDIVKNVKLTSAPLVEGTLAAVVAASAGQPLDIVEQEARQALQAKQMQLGDTQNNIPEHTHEKAVSADALIFRCSVPNRNGLHARPAARLVDIASQFNAECFLEKENNCVKANSLTQLTSLQIRHGDNITFYAQGVEAALAIKAFASFVSGNFGDPIEDEGSFEESHKLVFSGKKVENSLIDGTLEYFHTAVEDAAPILVDAEQTFSLALTALEHSENGLLALADEVKMRYGENYSDIFVAHALLVSDEDLQERIRSRIFDNGETAAEAISCELDELEDTYAGLADDYLRARAIDIRDIKHRVLLALTGKHEPIPEYKAPTILIAEDIYPSAFAQLDENAIKGVCLSKGNILSHSAILAKAKGIPMLMQLSDSILELNAGSPAKIDLEQQILIVDNTHH